MDRRCSLSDEQVEVTNGCIEPGRCSEIDKPKQSPSREMRVYLKLQPTDQEHIRLIECISLFESHSTTNLRLEFLRWQCFCVGCLFGCEKFLNLSESISYNNHNSMDYPQKSVSAEIGVRPQQTFRSCKTGSDPLQTL